ncbi:MAG: phosphodiester glycosidase family protein, partial [Oscillospiraceae bacterium]|nr:phosphodiester glycosidase family protein [Oscillospiraceae bacterium]
TYIPKHYSIPEGDTVAPKPREANFGSVSPDNAAQLLPVIEQARNSGLLEGQDMIFSPDLNFRPDTDIQYYYDETILTILWKELINGNTVSCCEVKIADASQFRRKFVDDTFGSSNKLFATSLAASVNAVVAMNADFYMFRDFGIVVYGRDLYRFSEANYTGSYKKYNCTDTMFVTDQGDLLFWHRLEEATPDEMKAWIDENHIVFSIAFGPVLVENGQLQVCDWYPAGEIDRGYSRAGIGQKDHLHYFYMSLNHSPEMEARWTVNQFGEHMYERGLQQAYCLDGGQTSEIVWRGAPFNYIDFGGEREVSDIIYFATAIPETEGTP